MTNTELLKEKLRESGYKLLHVAAACGITYAGFLKKLNNETEFKASEIVALKKALRLTNAERDAIFFASNVEDSSTSRKVGV